MSVKPRKIKADRRNAGIPKRYWYGMDEAQRRFEERMQRAKRKEEKDAHPPVAG